MKKAALVLEDGSVMLGVSIGALGHCVGEVVFNTSMTGYQEILTDPSYTKQIVTLTYPHIGNTGTNTLDQESQKVAASGLIIRDASICSSSWRSEESLEQFLNRNNIVAISNLDTRSLTRKLRDKGALNGCIITEDDKGHIDIDSAKSMIDEFPGLNNLDLAKEVTTKSSYVWQGGGEWNSLSNQYNIISNPPYHIIAYDFGIKENILRKLSQRGCHITVVPAKTNPEDILKDTNIDGVFLSNGPGDPKPCDYAIKTASYLIENDIPTFGICLGMQIISLALGAKTLKMKFGHHGANHPVENIETKKVYITSQNHGFAVDESTLPSNVKITHRSLFDGSLQGISLKDKPVIAFQGHPEASPGPDDIDELFEIFISMIKEYRKNRI